MDDEHISPAETQDKLEHKRIRRDKLSALRIQGKEQYHINSFAKTHLSNAIKEQFRSIQDTEVSITG